MLDELLVAFGIKAKNISALWEIPHADVDRYSFEENPDLAPGQSACLFHKNQLLPGHRFNVINGSLLSKIDRNMYQRHIRTRYGASSKSVSLADFCGEILVDAMTGTLFGERIYRFEPGMVQHLLEFNEDAWMLVFQVPQSANSKLSIARNKIWSGFQAYIQNPQGPDDGRAWLVDTALARYKHLQIDDGDRAGLLLMIYWA